MRLVDRLQWKQTDDGERSGTRDARQAARLLRRTDSGLLALKQVYQMTLRAAQGFAQSLRGSVHGPPRA